MEGKILTNIYNFNAGPSALPKSVLLEAQESMFNYKNSGLSVMEMSHRSPLYEEIHFNSLNKLRSLLSVPDDFEILFLQGGASLQFAMIPMNFLTPGKQAAFVLSGSWSEKAWKEASRIGETYILASTKDEMYRRIPEVNFDSCKENTAYIHLTSNNTIFGTQWPSYPIKDPNIPVCMDASSDILSRSIDWNQMDLVYAGAQKNAGPSGITIVIIRKSLMETANSHIPTILSYNTHAKSDSLYHTPPTGSIFILGLVMKWIEEQGGVEAMRLHSKTKGSLLYQTIDESDGFYVGHATESSRSSMNVTFNLRNEQLEKQFLHEAKAKGFVGLNGHRSIGGCRASIYNAVPLSHVESLVEFMKNFQKTHV
ncbi:3-phosphoserine/phosphohydroxythreonine transaminase [Evansella tamaricis]|uniref:Phosphoserine aminotransferase n=1 Tax=Evansella tamaricis TaxID=2069301 RepID=A0ABS6JG79_9BACI|nr:3-phosphoserine/phosphohydroxythreonine transaminase [Evansella tamaricis]MBU9712648.1 3-phosphoserine/phosphohydroxythreonine transaminase [Evansella tamaricis]